MPPTFQRFFVGKLAWRLYFISIAQLAVFIALCVVVVQLTFPMLERPALQFGQRVVRAFARSVSTPTEERDHALLLSMIDFPLAIYDRQGALLLAEGMLVLPLPDDVTNISDGVKRLDSLGPQKKGLFGLTSVRLANGESGLAVFALPLPVSPPYVAVVSIALVVLALLGAASLAVATSIAKPLNVLVAAARQVGEGKFTTRVNSRRSDELGEVSRAFDHMTSRLERWVASERELMANVSHELRTPLARIRVAVELAEEGNGEQSRRALATVSEDLIELDELIENLLTVGKLDIGNPPRALATQSVSMAAVLERALHRFRQANPERLLESRYPDEGPRVEVEPTLLGRAIQNVLANAHHYSDARKCITIEGDESNGRYTLRIRDEGVGMSGEDLARVGTPFFRADSSRNRKTGGVGLGLLLVKRIVEAHRGKLEVTSQVGVGTTVSLTLPTSL
jgi:two-component system, OmpR family, sensor kinase